MSDPSIKAAKALAESFAGLLPVIQEIEAAGGTASYRDRLNGNVEALRRDHATISSQIVDQKQAFQKARDEAAKAVAAIHSGAEKARADADKYAAEQRAEADAKIVAATQRAQAIIDAATEQAKGAIKSYEVATAASRREMEDAKRDLEQVNVEIDERRGVLAGINEQLGKIGKHAA